MDGLEHVSLGDPAVPLERAPQTARERLEALHTRATLSRLEVHTLRATERERWTARDEGEREREKRESEIARARQGNGCVETVRVGKCGNVRGPLRPQHSEVDVPMVAAGRV